MKRNKIIAGLLVCMMVSSTMAVAVSADEAITNPYEAQAVEYDKKAYAGNDLGANYTPEQTTFKFWSPSAEKVMLNIFTTGSDNEEGAVTLPPVAMKQSADNDALWTATVQGDLKDRYYTYSVTNKGQEVETVDPYAKAVGVNGERGMVVDLDTTDPDGWNSDNKFTRVENQSDATVWEIHVKDFSYDTHSGVSEANRGKYLAFTEMDTTLDNAGAVPTGMNYLKKLGINYVQINPMYDFGSVDEAGADTQFNWGYDPKNYNAPEGSYSSNPYDGNVRINEMKQMIKSLHDNGMGVIMDVVYNHTYSNDSVFQKSVPDYYYRINADGKFSNGSGCGNDTASERAMYRKYMIDSVTYWASEYHIDGFRFDLMGLHDVDTMNMIREALDEIDPNIIVYGEGWSLGSTFDTGAKAAAQANAKLLNSRVGCFNDQIRDGLKGSVFQATGKGYIQGDKTGTKAVYHGLFANTLRGGNWLAQTPEQTVTYASCHDNATLYDRLVYSMGGEFTERYDEYVKMNKLSAAVTFASQGVAFMLAGEEFARTKLGDENSYSSSPDENKLDWARTVEYADLLSYYKGMLEFRNYFDPVRTPVKQSNVTGDFNTDTGVVQVVYADNDFAWNNVVMLFSNSKNDEVVTLDSALPDKWVSVVDGTQAGIVKIDEFNGRAITIPAGEALILVDKTSYDASGITATKGKVVVNHVDESNGTVLATSTITGNAGENYVTMPSNAFALEYNLNESKTPENAAGTFADGTTTVTYYYTPNNVKFNDINGDGKVSLIDAALMQRYILGITTFTAEQIASGDINMNGDVDLSDVTLIQRYLLGYPAPKAIGTLTISYVDEDGNKLKPDVTTKVKAGTPYETTPADITYYSLVEDKLPENTSGKISVGNTTVTYVYKLNALQSTVRIKMPEGSTDVPNLYVWEEGGGDPNCGAWPGTTMTLNKDGWYEVSFATTGTYNWIVNYGGTQTVDMKDFSGDQWAIIGEDASAKVVTTTVNVKMADGVDWEPFLYVWQTNVQTGDKDYNPLGNWPGQQMTDFDKDGWYTVNFYCKGEEGMYNWIVNGNNGKQTADNTDVTGSIWVVMADDSTVASVTPEKP